MVRFSDAEYSEYLRKHTPVSVQNKYHNVKVYLYRDGFISSAPDASRGKPLARFDSQKEYQRFCELSAMQNAGEIADLRCQVSLLIQPAFTDADGVKRHAIVYRADFCYTQNGTEVVEDVKAFDKKTQKYLCTDVFRLKWKLLLYRYPDKIFRLY